MQLVSDGQSPHVILISPRAGVHEMTGAEDLQKYLEKMSGARLPIVTDREPGRPAIVLGTPETVGDIHKWEEAKVLSLAQLGREGYTIKSIGSDLAIAANTGGGAMYGVYGFLDDVLGCRFFMPDEQIGEYIPHCPTIELEALDQHQVPSLDLRAIAIFGRSTPTGWVRKNRMNYETFRECAGPGENGEAPANTTRLYPHGQFHTFNALVPAEKFFDEHPEWFPLIDGERTHAPYTQLCTSNPEVVEAVVANFRKVADADPAQRWFFLAPEDAHGEQYWCQCDNCRALDEPDAPLERWASLRYWTFLVAVAEKFMQSHPDRRIIAAAYKNYLWPPTTRKLTLPENVTVILCHQRPFCLLHPIEYNGHIENPNRTDARAESVVGSGGCFNQGFRDLIGTYANMAPLWIYEYYGKVGYFSMPFPLQRNLRTDFPFYHRSNVKGFYVNAADNFGTNGQLYYLTAKFCWNSDCNVDAILDDYFEHFYGPARGPMERYFDRLCDCFQDADICSDGYMYQYYDRRSWMIGVFNDALFDELTTVLDEADRCAGTELFRKRVQLSRFSLDFTRRMIALFEAMNDCERPGSDSPSKPERQRRARELQREVMTGMDNGRWGLAVPISDSHDYFFNAMSGMIDRAGD